MLKLSHWSDNFAFISQCGRILLLNFSKQDKTIEPIAVTLVPESVLRKGKRIKISKYSLHPPPGMREARWEVQLSTTAHCWGSAQSLESRELPLSLPVVESPDIEEFKTIGLKKILWMEFLKDLGKYFKRILAGGKRAFAGQNCKNGKCGQEATKWEIYLLHICVSDFYAPRTLPKQDTNTMLGKTQPCE